MVVYINIAFTKESLLHLLIYFQYLLNGLGYYFITVPIVWLFYCVVVKYINTKRKWTKRDSSTVRCTLTQTYHRPQETPAINLTWVQFEMAMSHSTCLNNLPSVKGCVLQTTCSRAKGQERWNRGKKQMIKQPCKPSYSSCTKVMMYFAHTVFH